MRRRSSLPFARGWISAPRRQSGRNSGSTRTGNRLDDLPDDERAPRAAEPGGEPRVPIQIEEAIAAAESCGAYAAKVSGAGGGGFVMLFADPVAAFANIARALKPRGRVAFVCWRGPDERGSFRWCRRPRAVRCSVGSGG